MRPRNVTEEEFREMKERVRGAQRVEATTGGRSGGEHRAVPDLATRPPDRQRDKPPSSPPFPPFQLALTGQLPSGKNQVQQLWRNGKVQRYPNKTFKNWRSQAMTQILEQANWGSRTIIRRPVCLTCNYWPGDQRTRDVSGQLDAIFSLLVYAKVLKDDGLIYNVTWRRHEMNRKFPKVVMEIEAWEP